MVESLNISNSAAIVFHHINKNKKINENIYSMWRIWN